MAVSREHAREVLIQRLYERSNDSEAEPEFEEEEICDLVRGQIAPVIVHTILVDLLHSRLIRQTRAAPVMFEVTDSLLDEAEMALVLARPNRQTDGSPPSIISASVPASDRFVSLDHNGDPFREAMAALDNALQAFRNDHRLDNFWGSERGVLIRTMEAGRELLHGATVRVATIFTTIVSPLRIIRDAYEEAIAKSLIVVAVEQVVGLVERALSAVLTLIGWA